MTSVEAPRLYRPENAAEGCLFIAKWCEICRHDDMVNSTGCEILADAIMYHTSDPDFPESWTYDDNNKPCCTRFERSPHV